LFGSGFAGLGENRLMKILTFEGNILKKIEDGDYGTGPSR
jgi:hypothetical protein